MDQNLAQLLADEWEQWTATGDSSFLQHFAPDFRDNVSGQTGLDIFDLIGRWNDESFADRRVQHHATMTDGDRVMFWYTQHGRHIGNGFPRLAGRAIAGTAVLWPQVHVLRVVGDEAVEHWAVRDDFRMIEQITQAAND